MLQTISVTSAPSQKLRVKLDGREYVLRLRWSEREERWYLDVLDGKEVLLAGAIKIVANWPLLEAQRFSEALPPGEIMAMDGRTSPADPGLRELGTTIPLVYLPAADVAGGVT